MSLKDILAAKKQNKEIVQEEKKEEENIEKYFSTEKYLSSSEYDELFIALHSLLIRNPYTLFHEKRELISFLLDSNVHVLNTFPLLNIELIFSLYMSHNPPKQAHDLHKLYVHLCHLQLCVPAQYEEQICSIIASHNKLDKG